MQRRKFLSGAAAGLGLAAAARGTAFAAATVTTQLQWIKDSQNAGWYIADANGYFRAQGIESVLVAGGPNLSSGEAVVAANRADVGMDQLERMIDANNAGSDLVAFGALYQKSPSALLSLPKNPVRTAHDIVGKRLGLQQGAKVYIDAILKVNHLPPGSYTEVVVGSTPDPLVEGACDAYLCFITNQPLVLAERKIPYVTATFDQLGYATYTDCLFASRDFIKNNRDTLVRYVRALQHGWLECVHDPELAAKLTLSTYGAGLGLTESKELATARAQGPLLESADTKAHGMLWIDKARVAGQIYTTLRATGRTNLPPVDHIVDTSILIDAGRKT